MSDKRAVLEAVLAGKEVRTTSAHYRVRMAGGEIQIKNHLGDWSKHYSQFGLLNNCELIPEFKPEFQIPTNTGMFTAHTENSLVFLQGPGFHKGSPNGLNVVLGDRARCQLALVLLKGIIKEGTFFWASLQAGAGKRVRRKSAASYSAGRTFPSVGAFRMNYMARANRKAKDWEIVE